MKTKHIRIFELRETIGGAPVLGGNPQVEVDEDLDVMNKIWFQCCIKLVRDNSVHIVDPPPAEVFADVGYDKDQNPQTPPEGIGNGVFDFTDINGNNLHDRDGLNPEPGEPFTDSNGNALYDFKVTLTLEAPEPGGAFPFCAGVTTHFDDPLLNPDGTSSKTIEFPSREQRQIIDTFGDGNTSTIEYFIINNFCAYLGGDQGANASIEGEAFIPLFPRNSQSIKPGNINVIFSEASEIGKDDATGEARSWQHSAHEVGHVLTNEGHRSGDAPPDGVNLMHEVSDSGAPMFRNKKRLDIAQRDAARSF